VRLFILITLLSLFAVSAFAQPADTTATAVQQPADTSAVAAPSQTAPPQAAPAQAATTQTTPPQATESSSNGPSWKKIVKLGAGVHYMKTVGDIKDAEGFDSNALNLLIAARVNLGLIKIEGDSEWAFDYGGSSKTLWIPQAFALVGNLIYGGVGIGTGYIDGEWFDNPVYTLRVGANIPLAVVSVDVNANYQFMDSSAFEGIDTEDLDSVTFGAVVWF
jgi:hypothetical protein